MKLSYVNFITLSQAELLQILAWRNSDEVRLNLKQQQIISAQEHLNFCKALKDRPDLRYYRVDLDDRPCGVVTYTALNFTQGEGEYGLYTISKQPGVGVLMAKTALYLFFKVLMLKTLKIEVLDFNKTALRFNEDSLGFCNPHYEEKALTVNGQQVGIYSYTMTSEDWSSRLAPTDLKLLRRLTLEFEGAPLSVS